MRFLNENKPYHLLIEDNFANLSKLADYLGCYEIAKIVLENKLFKCCSGSSDPQKHHYGTGGLIQHTYEVITLSIKAGSCYGQNDYFTKKLYLAGLFHDFGKTYDYSVTYGSSPDEDVWRSSYPHKRRIHHISRSALLWQQAYLDHQSSYEWLTSEFSDDILHAILAHHGRREWGSPISPDTPLAWILHLCDGISARVNDCDLSSSHK